MFITNQEIAKIFYEISAYLDMDEIPFKPAVYEKAAQVIESLGEEVADIYKKGGLSALERIRGVGASIAEKIEELIKTDRLKYYGDLKKKMPVNLSELLKIEGLGPKRIKVLYEKLRVRNLTDLENAATFGKIRKLEGFGKKSEENILRGIAFCKRSSGRFILGFILPAIRDIENRLRSLEDVGVVNVAGSVRRRKETIGDADFLVISDRPKKVMDFFVNLPQIAYVIAHGETKSMIKLKNGLDVDLRIVPKKSYGAAIAYFTGSKEHNIKMREMAMKRGWKLNEYGLFDAKNKQIAGGTEEELYSALGMDYVEPELREMRGEIEAALNRKLPELIKYDELVGDLQVQTNWTDGSGSIEAMADAAMKSGLKYIAITDHTKRLPITGGLDERGVEKQGKEIDLINKKLEKGGIDFSVLKGTECDILKDGSLDLSDKILAKLDIVGVAVHSNFNLSKKDQTRRIIKAMSNPYVDILFHPTGRVLQRREAYELDIDEVLKTAEKTGTVLEVDAFPDRLDFNDEYAKMAINRGIKLAIDSDAHSPEHFAVLEFGIAQARRGWATKHDVINAWPLEKMQKFLKRNKAVRNF